jgi:hypothetical protein
MTIDFQQAFISYALSVTDITTLIGRRLLPVYKAQNAQLPVVIYQTISDNPQITHSGYNNLNRIRLQLTIWSSSYATAKAIRDAFNAHFIGFRGDMAGLTIGGVLPGGTDKDDWEPETQLYQWLVDYMFQTGGI